MEQWVEELETGNRFDLIENYDEEIPDHVQQYYLVKKSSRIIAKLYAYLDDLPMKGADIGCGTGDHIHYIMRTCPHLSIDGVDNSSRQLELARCKLYQAEHQGGHYCDRDITYFHTSMEDLPVDDHTYDFAYAINSIHHLPTPDDQLDVFAEIHRVLKPGGLFMIVEMNVINPIIHFYLSHIFPKLRNIDEGDEQWITPDLIHRSEFTLRHTDYFTFTPDFLPKFLLPLFQRLDACLDQTQYLARLGAHVMFTMVK